MAGDIEIRRFEISPTLSALFTDVTLSPPVDPAHTRVVIANTGHSDIVPVQTGHNSLTQLSCIIELLNSTTVRVHHGSTIRVREVRFEVWEYVGISGGPNEFEVLERGKVTVPDNTFDFNINLTTDYPGIPHSKVSLTNTGSFQASTIADNNQRRQFAVRKFIFIIWYIFGLLRGDKTGAADVGYELIYWKGSNWTIQSTFDALGVGVYAFTMTFGVPEVLACQDVGNWATAWIEGARTSAFNHDANQGTGLLPGTTTTTIRVWQGITGSSGGFTGIGYWIYQNPNVFVDHKGSHYSGAAAHPAATPHFQQTVLVGPAAPGSLVDDFVRQTAICWSTGNAATTNYGDWPWNHKLVDTGGGTRVVNWHRGHADFVSEWHQQIIQFPERFHRFLLATSGTIAFDSLFVIVHAVSAIGASYPVPVPLDSIAVAVELPVEAVEIVLSQCPLVVVLPDRTVTVPDSQWPQAIELLTAEVKIPIPITVEIELSEVAVIVKPATRAVQIPADSLDTTILLAERSVPIEDNAEAVEIPLSSLTIQLQE